MNTPSTSSHYGSSQFPGPWCLPIHLFWVICSEPCSQMETPGSHLSGLPSAIYPWIHCWVLVLWSLLCKLPLTFPKQHLSNFFLNESTGLVKWHDPLFLTQFLRGLGTSQLTPEALLVSDSFSIKMYILVGMASKLYMSKFCWSRLEL